MAAKIVAITTKGAGCSGIEDEDEAFKFVAFKLAVKSGDEAGLGVAIGVFKLT